MAEWIVYHSCLGFDRIWIYDNGSEDKIETALRPYRDRIELIHWPHVPAFPSNVVDCLVRAREQKVDWLALFDADEFLVPASGDSSEIRRTLTQMEQKQIDEIWIPVHFYSSAGHILIPDGRVVDNYRTETDRHISKSIVRVASNPTPHTTHGFGSPRHKRVRWLRINHYRNKSKEDDLIRRGKGFVDEWGMKFLSDEVLNRDRARRQTLVRKISSQNDSAVRLSAEFKTPGTQRELGIDPVKIFIFERNQPDGLRLQEQLSSVFRDVILCSVGSNSLSLRVHPKDENVTDQINRAHMQGGRTAVLWFLRADQCLNNAPRDYKEAIVSAFPFGIWSPKIHGLRRKDQYVRNGRLWSVHFVESVAWAVSLQARTVGFPLPSESSLGWGQDLILSRRCLEAGMRNLIDGRVSISYLRERTFQAVDPVEAQKQMISLLARVFPDGQTFGSPSGRPGDMRNVFSEALSVS
jgi:hypothetical protein